MTGYEAILCGFVAMLWLPLVLGALYAVCDMLVEAVSYWIS